MELSVIDEIGCNGLVPVMKFKNASDAVPACRAVSRGGLNVAEITFRTDAAEEAIRAVCAAFPDMIVGAGTVTTVEQAQRARQAGAQFIVMPGFNPKVVSWCVEQGVPVVPGVNDPSGIEAAMELGLNCVKFFPAEASGGVKFLKAVHAPYANVTFMPTGGVNEDNLCEYLAVPGVIACGGSWMVPSDAVEKGDCDTVESLVRRAVQKMLRFRLAHVGINTGSAEHALATAELLARLFGFEAKEGGSSVMSASAVELMKVAGHGTNGHIGIATSSVDRAVYFLERKGFAFDAQSEKRDPNGARKIVYFRDEIAGFAFHLVQG